LVRGDSLALVELTDGLVDQDVLATALHDVPVAQGVPVLHLVDDLDGRPDPDDRPSKAGGNGGGEQSPLIVIPEAVRRVHQGLLNAVPALEDEVWVVIRSGPEVGAIERELAEELLSQGEWVGGVVVVGNTTRSSTVHRPEEVDAAIADLIHSLRSRSFRRQVMQGTAWAAGVTSVVYRPDRHLAAEVVTIDPTLRSISDPIQGDVGFTTGERWVRERLIGPPLDSDAVDVERSLLLEAGGAGSVVQNATQGLERLRETIESRDPGTWAGLIAAAVDVATAPRTHPTAPASAVEVAFGQVDVNAEARRSELAAALVVEARRDVEGQGNLTSELHWCDGVRSELRAARERLRPDAPESQADLRSAQKRLSRRTALLPYSAPFAVRAVLLVIISVILGYAFAPITWFVAWAFTARLPWLSDDPATNAQIWARITAGAVGVACWAWWEFSWRRVRRLKNLYLDAAEQLVESMVLAHLVRRREELIDELLQLVGTAHSGPGTVHHWLRASLEAVRSVRELATTETEDERALGTSRYTLTLPRAEEVDSLLGNVPERVLELSRAPSRLLSTSDLTATGEVLFASICAELVRVGGPRSADLLTRLEEGFGRDPAPARLLATDVTPAGPDLFTSGAGQQVEHWIVGPKDVSDSLAEPGVNLETRATIRVIGEDPCFCASIRLLTLKLETTTAHRVGAADPGPEGTASPTFADGDLVDSEDQDG